jgi:hypothetical protein
VSAVSSISRTGYTSTSLPEYQKKMHLVMYCQQASCEDSDYTEFVGRMGTTPQVINVRERQEHL